MGRHILTFNGGVTLSPTERKFGRTSYYFGGTDDFLSFSNSSDFDLGVSNDPFTIDFWFNSNSSESALCFWNRGGTVADWNMTNGFQYLLQYQLANTRIYFYYNNNGSAVTVSSPLLTLDGAWHHVAVVYDGTTTKIAIDGIFGTGVTTGGYYTPATRTNTKFGSYITSGGEYVGYLDELRITKGLARWSADFSVPTEPSQADDKTVLLLHCKGDFSAENTHAITTVGTPQLVHNYFPPDDDRSTSNYGGSIYFNGTTDYLSMADSTDWSFGAGDFSFDAWIRFDGTPSNPTFFAHNNGGGNTDKFFFDYYSSNLRFIYQLVAGGGDTTLSFAWTPSINTWYHLALIRSGNTLRAYVDGTQVGTDQTLSATLPSVSSTFLIGANPDSLVSTLFKGYMAGVRISKGIARWISTFEPTNKPYSQYQEGIDGYTKLMLHMDGGNGSSVFTDSSITPKTITVSGAIQNSSVYKFGKSSAYFDGDGDYLSLADSSDWDFADGNFTVEFWARWISNTSDVAFVTQGNSGNDIWTVQYILATNRLQLYRASGSDQKGNFYASFTPSLDTWYHIAIVRSGSSCYMFVNGISLTVTETDPFSLIADLSQPLTIGANSTWPTWYFDGYIDELRISKGIARWTSNFTPPTRPYDQANIDGYTKLLLHLNGTNGATVFPDSGVTGHVVSANGDAEIVSNTTYKFGKSSCYFDGNGDYLSIPDSSDWNFSTGNFTLDFWIYLNSLKNYNGIMGQYSDVNNRWILHIGSTGLIGFYAVDTSVAIAEYMTSSPALSASTWYHLAIVRNGSSFYIFINGDSASLTTTTAISTNSMPDFSVNFDIGRCYVGGAYNYLDGYLNEVRISKGIARWTADFAPPARPYGLPVWQA